MILNELYVFYYIYKISRNLFENFIIQEFYVPYICIISRNLAVSRLLRRSSLTKQISQRFHFENQPLKTSYHKFLLCAAKFPRVFSITYSPLCPYFNTTVRTSPKFSTTRQSMQVRPLRRLRESPVDSHVPAELEKRRLVSVNYLSRQVI